MLLSTYATNAGGNFAFHNLPFGRYILQETNPPGFPSDSTPNTVVVDTGMACEKFVFFGDYVPVLGVGCPCPNWVLFNSDRDGNWEIYGADPYTPSTLANTVEINLTNSPGNDREYALSSVATANGMEPRIAFQSDRDGDWEIYILNPLTGAQMNATHRHSADDKNPTWNQTCPSHLIAFESNRDGNWEIYLLDTTTGFQRNLTHSGGSDLAPQWSPDDRFIAFQSNRDGNWEIYVVNVATGALTRLTNHGAADVDPAWSFDGRYLLFRSFRDGNWEIYRLTMNTSGNAAIGSGLVNLTNNPADDRNYVWQPDVSVQDIAFQSNRSGNWDIYVMATDGSNLRQITTDTADDEYPTWDCLDAVDLFFQSNRDGNWEIYKYQSVDDTMVRWTYHAANDRYPAWRPDEIRWSDEIDQFAISWLDWSGAYIRR